MEKREEPQDEDWIHRSLLGIACALQLGITCLLTLVSLPLVQGSPGRGDLLAPRLVSCRVHLLMRALHECRIPRVVHDSLSCRPCYSRVTGKVQNLLRKRETDQCGGRPTFRVQEAAATIPRASSTKEVQTQRLQKGNCRHRGCRNEN